MGSRIGRDAPGVAGGAPEESLLCQRAPAAEDTRPGGRIYGKFETLMDGYGLSRVFRPTCCAASL
ncbi:MAG: hypothetical protein GX880_05210 [Methanomicrobiales archaeon]|nr:hypothetical protein [Methanomicrobiales archaeon]